MTQIITFLLVFITLCNFLIAQNVETIIEIDDDIGSMAIHGDFLYLVVSDDKITSSIQAEERKIVRMDITAPNPTFVDVVRAPSTILSIAFHENDLYFSVSYGNFSSNSSILKIDITDTTSTITEVFTRVESPESFLFDGDDLYVLSGFRQKISKADLTEPTPVLTEFLSFSDTTYPFEFALHNDDLYISVKDSTASKIVKTNITATNPVLSDVLTGINLAESFAFKGDELYLSFPYDDDKISKINVVTSTLPTKIVTDILTDRDDSSMLDIAFSGDDLYLGESTLSVITSPVQIIETQKILKLNVSETISSTDFNTAEKLVLFPNPADDFIKISSLEPDRAFNFTIYNSTGIEVKNGNLLNDGIVNIQIFLEGCIF